MIVFNMNNRLLILNRRYCPGEAWTNRVLAYAKGFAELGMDVTIYYLISDKKRTPSDANIAGVKIVNLWEHDGWLAKKFRIFSFIKNLLRFKREVKVGDWVYQYGVRDYQLWLVNKLKHRAKLFCEVTEHPKFNGGSNFLSKRKRTEILRSLDALFVISQKLKSLYVDLGVDEDRIHIVNMFVDSTRFEGLTNMSKEKYIAYCGAVSYDKDGVNILVEAFSKFHRTHQDYRLYIIGKGIDHNVINKLKWLAQKEEVEDAVVFTGSIPPSEMPQMLYDASILALSRPDNLQAQNGFPTKLGEYLATGKPVVVTGVGEIPLFIKDGVNGYLSEPNSDSFADKLSYVADHYSEALNVGCEGKKLSQEAFNYRTQCNVVRNVMNDYYKELKISAFNGGGYKGNLKGFFFIVCYRIAHFFTQNKALYLIGTPVWLLYRFIFRWMLGIDVPERVILGSNCRVCHGIGLVIHPGVVIGDNVKLHQNTTIGIVNGGQPPRLGSNIIIGANSVIIGNIKIGDGAIVGAGAVVTKDVPQNAVVVGNPARIIKYRNLE